MNGVWCYVLSYKAQSFSDNTGLYTQIDIGKNGQHHMIRIPEGKLPFTGDAWESYQALDRAYDRESLGLTIEQNDSQAVASGATDVFQAVLAGALTGGTAGTVAIPGIGTVAGAVVGAVAGLAIALGTTVVTTILEDDAARKEQELKERHIKQQPGTGYQIGYGLSYLFNSSRIGAGFVLYEPPSITANKVEWYGRVHGFVSEGVETVSLNREGGGFYSGRLINISGADMGPKFDRLAQMFIQGLVLIPIEYTPPTDAEGE